MSPNQNCPLPHIQLINLLIVERALNLFIRLWNLVSWDFKHPKQARDDMVDP